MPNCNRAEENDVINKARKLLATYEDMAELIRLGAYRGGTDVAVDEAIHYYPMIEGFLAQSVEEKCDLEEGYKELYQMLGFKSKAELIEVDRPDEKLTDGSD